MGAFCNLWRMKYVTLRWHFHFRENPAERLGYQKNGYGDIKKHIWFSGFIWENLKLQTIQPPIVPKIGSIDDHSNFDEYPDDDDIPPEETSGWDVDFWVTTIYPRQQG